MAIGPVQLIVLGFEHPEFHGEIIAELERLKESDTVRVIDALAVHKDADGEIEVAHLSNLSNDEAIELGGKVGALVGLGIEGEEGMQAGAEAGAQAAADGISAFSDEDAWDVIEELERLRESDTVRVIDALAVHKDAEGEIEVAHLSNLTLDEAVELGTRSAP